MESLQPAGSNMPFMKMEDTQYFSKLLEDVDETELSSEEQKEREIMRLLLKIKNGTPPMRKVCCLDDARARAGWVWGCSLVGHGGFGVVWPMTTREWVSLVVCVVSRLCAMKVMRAGHFSYTFLVFLKFYFINISWEHFNQKNLGRDVSCSLKKKKSTVLE